LIEIKDLDLLVSHF